MQLLLMAWWGGGVGGAVGVGSKHKCIADSASPSVFNPSQTAFLAGICFLFQIQNLQCLIWTFASFWLFVVILSGICSLHQFLGLTLTGHDFHCFQTAYWLSSPNTSCLHKTTVWPIDRESAPTLSPAPWSDWRFRWSQRGIIVCMPA